MRPIRLIRTLLVLLVVAVPAVAAEPHPNAYGFGWESSANDTRSVSLGRADLAAGGGPAAFWLNPATLPERDHARAAYRFSQYPVEGDIRGVSVAGELGRFQVGWSRAEYEIEGVPIGVIDDPFVAGETYGVKERIDVVALSYGLRRRLQDRGTQLEFACGAAVRIYDASVAGISGSATDLDLGVTVRYTRNTARGWYGARGAITARNITGQTYRLDGVPVYLPHNAGLGVVLEGGRFLGWRDENDLRGLLTYTHRKHIRTHFGNPDNSNHIGGEVSVYDALAIRVGYTDIEFGGGRTSWGLGLSSRGLVDSRFELTIDYGQFDAGRLGGWLDLVSLAGSASWDP